jgi:hypothetical protein
MYTQLSMAKELRFTSGLSPRESVTITFSCIQTVAAGCRDNSSVCPSSSFVIAYYFAVSDLSVFRDVSEFDEEIGVGARDVPNGLE